MELVLAEVERSGGRHCRRAGEQDAEPPGVWLPSLGEG
jgi:hypothetical protein